MSAVLDTGAEGGVFKEATCERENLDIDSRAPGVTFLFGGGDEQHSTGRAALGITSGHVVKGAVEDLISINDFIDKGSYVYLDRHGGRVANRNNAASIPVWRRGLQWRVWLSDVKDYDYIDKDSWAEQLRVRRADQSAQQQLREARSRLTMRSRTIGFRRKGRLTVGRLRQIRDRDEKERGPKLSKSFMAGRKMSSIEEPTDENGPKYPIGPSVDDDKEIDKGYAISDAEQAQLGSTRLDVKSSGSRSGAYAEMELGDFQHDDSSAHSDLEQGDIRHHVRRGAIDEAGKRTSDSLSISKKGGRQHATARTRYVPPLSVMSRFYDVHERGHVHPKYMCKAVTGDNPAWRNCGLTAGQISRCAKAWSCPTCVLAKRRKMSIPINEKDPNDFDRDKSPLNSKNCLPGSIRIDIAGSCQW